MTKSLSFNNHYVTHDFVRQLRHGRHVDVTIVSCRRDDATETAACGPVVDDSSGLYDVELGRNLSKCRRRSTGDELSVDASRHFDADVTRERNFKSDRNSGGGLRRFPAHRAALHAISPSVFAESLFASGDDESPQLLLVDISSAALEQFINLIYTGSARCASQAIADELFSFLQEIRSPCVSQLTSVIRSKSQRDIAVSESATAFLSRCMASNAAVSPERSCEPVHSPLPHLLSPLGVEEMDIKVEPAVLCDAAKDRKASGSQVLTTQNRWRNGILKKWDAVDINGSGGASPNDPFVLKVLNGTADDSPADDMEDGCQTELSQSTERTDLELQFYSDEESKSGSENKLLRPIGGSAKRKRKKRLERRLVDSPPGTIGLNLRRSIREKRREKHLSSVQRTKDENASDTSAVECAICKKAFSNKAKLSKHMKDHKYVGCEHCTKKFLNVNELQFHMSTHSSPKGSFKCDQCGRQFTTGASLRAHMFLHRTYRPFPCDRCEKSYTTKSQLRNHSLMHDGKKPKVCHLCQKAFREQTALRHHIMIHEGLKPYLCNQCGKSFLHKGHLDAHCLIHEGVRRFICDVCANGFTTPRSLQKHLLVHKEPGFVCTVCSQAFRRSDHLKNHSKKHCSTSSGGAVDRKVTVKRKESPDFGAVANGTNDSLLPP